MAGTSLRSLRPAAVAVGVTGALSIAMPVMLVTGLIGIGKPSAVPDALLRPELRSCAGSTLAKPVVLYPGDCVVVLAAGFDASQRVIVHEQSRPDWSQTISADPAGRLSFRLVLDAEHRAGREVLSFIGRGAAAVAGSAEEPAQQHVSVCSFTVAGG